MEQYQEEKFEIRVIGPLRNLWADLLTEWGHGQVGPIVSRETFKRICQMLIARTSVQQSIPLLVKQLA